MSRYLSYNDEMKRLQQLLVEVSTDKESINEENKEIADKEYFSDHQPILKWNLIQAMNLIAVNHVNIILVKIRQLNEEVPRKKERTFAHNIVRKLPGTLAAVKDLSSPIHSWQLLID